MELPRDTFKMMHLCVPKYGSKYTISSHETKYLYVCWRLPQNRVISGRVPGQSIAHISNVGAGFDQNNPNFVVEIKCMYLRKHSDKGP